MYCDWKNSMVSIEFQYGHQFSRWWLLRDSKLAFSSSSGTADSFLSASSVTRTHHMHQVTACCLYMLRKEAYEYYCVEINEGALNFNDWCETCKEENPQFQFWELVLSMELVIFSLVRSFREANFNLYCQALSALIPFFFANNNVNYAQWPSTSETWFLWSKLILWCSMNFSWESL